MDYVMVPVPEEHVIDVMQHVARLVARASIVPWDDEALQELFDEIDEASRSLIGLTARTTSTGKNLTDEEAAKTLELNVREVRAIVRDLQVGTQREKHPPIVVIRDDKVLLRNGRWVEQRLLVMDEAVARTIRAHERASLGDLAVDVPDSLE